VAARAALAIEGIDLLDVRYPGFEGRPPAPDLEGFLRAVSEQVAAAVMGADGGLVYGTGIGGLIALCLRSRGHLVDVPLVLQAPVLWGLERRLMPRVMRMRLARAAVSRVFASAPFQRHFVRRHFMRRPSREVQAAFFDGYARCVAFRVLFAWFTPGLLRDLELGLAARPEAVQNVTVWWGGRDRVVTPRELGWTEDALATKWPVTFFPEWGHYPMIDEPEAWARALRDGLAQRVYA
jgi:pimeloyl-ACP methyl ester carboxylesterase